MADYKLMPEPVARRRGCKVGWYYYSDKAAAFAAAKIAEHNGAIKEAAGFDFGYQSPGSVHRTSSDSPYGRPELKGLWEVCVA